MLTAILLEFTHNKIEYRLYHEDNFLGYLNFVPSLEHQKILLEKSWDFVKWSNWIKKMYQDAYILTTLKKKDTICNLFVCPINGHIKYSLFLPHFVDEKNGYYFIVAFKGINNHEKNTMQYNYLHNIIISLKKDNKVKISFI